MLVDAGEIAVYTDFHFSRAGMAMSELPLDPRLPQLAQALDGERMRAVLGAHFGPCTCAIERVRYVPGERAQVSYRLATECAKTSDRLATERPQVSYRLATERPQVSYRLATERAPQEVRLSARIRPHDVRLSARIYPLADAARRAAKESPDLYVAALGLLGWRFPRDRKLVHLALFADPAILRRHVRPDVVDAALVRYVAEQSATVRVTTAAGDVLYGKTYRDNGDAARVFATMRRLAIASVALPRPESYQPAFNALWCTAVRGDTLLAHLRDGAGVAASEWRALGATLAKLHRAPPTECLAVDRPIDRLQTSVRVIERALPAQTARVRAIARRLESALRFDPPGTVVHGDLHPQNVLLAEGVASLIDFDAVAIGAPAADLGSLQAALYADALACGRPIDVDDAIAELLDGYAPFAPARITRRLLSAHTACALIAERAYRAITRLKPGRRALVAALIEHAEALADVACRENVRARAA